MKSIYDIKRMMRQLYNLSIYLFYHFVKYSARSCGKKNKIKYHNCNTSNEQTNLDKAQI